PRLLRCGSRLQRPPPVPAAVHRTIRLPIRLLGREPTADPRFGPPQTRAQTPARAPLPPAPKQRPHALTDPGPAAAALCHGVGSDWTVAGAVGTVCFWWIVVGCFFWLFAWYAVQVHQTKYLVEVGFSRALAGWALGLVSLVAVPGQIALGHLSDRIGREWVW